MTKSSKKTAQYSVKFRNAANGRYVSKLYAVKNPNTTVKEKDKKK